LSMMVATMLPPLNGQSDLNLDLRRISCQDDIELTTLDADHLALGLHESSVSVEALLNGIRIRI
jgi:hypothetical protein